MKLYATRRECEMLLQGLHMKMGNIPMSEMVEFQALANRIIEVCEKQCPQDKTKYNGGTDEHNQ